VAAARGGGVTIYATLLGGETRSARNTDLTELLAWGLSRYRTVWAVAAGRVYATARTAYERPRVRLVAAKPALRVVHVERPLVERVVAPVEVALPVRMGQRLGEVQVLDRGKVIARSPLVAANAVARPDSVERIRFYAGRALDHLGGLFS
jgi:D-alanyl-D-alanine carboxypeptidase (penicillin-binding protein 5/6)